MEDVGPVLSPPLVHLFHSFMRQCMRIMDEAGTDPNAPRLHYKVCSCVAPAPLLLPVLCLGSGRRGGEADLRLLPLVLCLGLIRGDLNCHDRLWSDPKKALALGRLWLQRG